MYPGTPCSVVLVSVAANAFKTSDREACDVTTLAMCMYTLQNGVKLPNYSKGAKFER